VADPTGTPSSGLLVVRGCACVEELHLPDERERDAVPAEPIGQELTNERHVAADGRLRQHPLVAQVGFERLCGVLNRRPSTEWDRRCTDDPLVSQKVKQLAQRGGVVKIPMDRR
jgi:hypothetical protein